MDTPNFLEKYPTASSSFRAVVLFGQNVASYKFALAHTLLGFAKEGRSDITLDELSLPFALEIVRHLKMEDKQATSQSSRFIDACRKFNVEEIDLEELQKVSRTHGLRYVLDAFHVVGRASIETTFYTYERHGAGSVVLTDDLLRLAETSTANALSEEVEARWRLVETAWSCGISPRLLEVHRDPETEELFLQRTATRRISITSSRGALNGYQKGRCFYCCNEIVVSGSHIGVDVDHFFPWVLATRPTWFQAVNIDGVWNLVLSCELCNRGEGGKFERIPTIEYLEKLYTRNEWLVGSHHPLRETIIRQTGRNSSDRRVFLQTAYTAALSAIPVRWRPRQGLVSDQALV